MAVENGLSETAFAVRENGGYHLRWFAPGGEIDLCGHATLACAYVLLNFYETGSSRVVFQTMRGTLTVERRGALYEMDFPAYDLRPVPVTAEMTASIGAAPLEAYMGRDLLCVLPDEDTIRALRPDQERVKLLDGLLLHVTAPGRDHECVSRTVAPKCGVPEDPVCGSGHCHIVPYWSQKLGKSDILACQAPPRGGLLTCRMAGNRVRLAGHAALYSIAEVFLCGKNSPSPA